MHENPAVGFAVHFWFEAQKLSGAPAQSWAKKQLQSTGTVPNHADYMQASRHGKVVAIAPHASSGATIAFRHAFIRSALNVTRPAATESLRVTSDRSHERLMSSRHCS